ncbi:unnamed protein product [Strongylus vulgaris]|uniref:SCP domain-containing protein n=1 Tax=Strongylus vulgaris TaxID=40348 RepID=A0A3P7J5C8_STRVU|nr:unnamed protein product [Strongylus vulgaris]
MHRLPALVLLLNCVSWSFQTCDPNSTLSTKAVDLHNDVRKAVATGTYGPKSQTMFRVSYDCTNDGLALAVIGDDCRRNKAVDLTPLGKATSFIKERTSSTTMNDNTAATYYQYAVEDWIDAVDTLSDATYNDEIPEEFANSYDCTNDGLALAIIGDDCRRNKAVDLTPLGKATSFIKERTSSTTMNDNTAATYYQYAVEDWIDAVDTLTDATYNDEIPEEFANVR